jgi:hypothetical protein
MRSSILVWKVVRKRGLEVGYGGALRVVGSRTDASFRHSLLASVGHGEEDVGDEAVEV